jgi:acetylornithine deacetylase/succinyl-diaminopimelate desuccinylase-like protein
MRKVPVLVALFTAGTIHCAGQSRPATTSTPDAQIAAALRQISAEHIQSNIEKLVSFGTRSTLSAGDSSLQSTGHGIDAAQQWIASELQRYAHDCGGCLDVQTFHAVEQPGERIKTPTEITDIYAVMKGTDAGNSERMVLVTGHYDSRNSDNFDAKGDAPGANDDASGTAVSLECARVLSKLKFPATIVFLTVAGEEQGLYGSKHFAEMARQRGWNLEAVLNNDIVGGDKNPDQNPAIVRVFSEGLPIAATDQEIQRIRSLGGENDSASRELARYIAEVGKTYDTGVTPMLVFRLDRYLRGGDHSSFNQEGFAAVRFTELRENFNHQHQNVRSENGVEYGDLPKFVDYAYVARVARLNAATLAALASAPAPPANVHLLVKGLQNSSTLTWDESPGGLAAGYEVLWRATSSPDWENVLNVGSVTRITLQVSKDESIFAVRAVDRAGHRSLPVIPTPER